jgi:hypothetical protein
MVGFLVVLGWLGLLSASFAWSSLRPLANETGPYIIAIILGSLVVVRPLERHFKKKAKA